MVFNVSERIVVFPCCLKRVVNAPVCKVEKERAIAIGFDHLDRFVCVVVGEVPLRLKVAASVEARCIACVGPDHPFDAVVFALCVNHTRIILG